MTVPILPIVVVSSPDGMNWTTEATFEKDPAEYAEVHDPSIYIDGDTKYIIYSCHNLSNDSYDLIKHVDAGTGFDAGDVILYSYVGEIEDVQCISGTTLGQHLFAVTTVGIAHPGVFCCYSIGGTQLVAISDLARDAAMPDFIFDPVPGSPDAYLHLVWCERDDPTDNWEVFYRRGYLELQ